MSCIHRIHRNGRTPALALTALATATLLAACGGGGSTAETDPISSDPGTVSPAGQVVITGTVTIAAPLQGATACYDL